MKQIEIIIPHERLSKVNEILYKHNVGGIMFYEIKGRGKAKREAPVITNGYHYGEKYGPEFGSRTMVDVMVSDSSSKQIVDEIIRNLSTGNDSDGKIFVKDVSEVYDIGLRQQGELAL